MDSRRAAANSLMLLTRSVSFASVDTSLLPLFGPPQWVRHKRVQTREPCRKLYTQTPARKLRLPAAAGANATAAAASKTTETSATAPRTTAAAASSTAEHATDHGANPPPPATSAAAR